MLDKPLVTVIALCYNHERFLIEALDSVWHQSYPTIELIIVDDQSSDQSPLLIQQWHEAHSKDLSKKDTTTNIHLILHEENQGVCSSFNEALEIAQGDFIIDFATDDVMLETRIADQIHCFENLDTQYGVVFSNAMLLDEDGCRLQEHHSIEDVVPQGNIYIDILSKYFISTPTMMTRREVYDTLEGYDGNLSYEDFDFWVRSSRIYKYAYLDKVTTLRRIVKGSLSSQFYKKKHNPLLADTLKVCKKAYKLNRNTEEHKALSTCIQYHLRQCFFMQNFALAKEYKQLLDQPNLKAYTSFATKLVFGLNCMKIPVYRLYLFYLKVRGKNNL